MSKILSLSAIGGSTRGRRVLASAATLLAAGALLLVWPAPTTSEAQPKFDVQKFKKGEVPQIPSGLLQALKQQYPDAVAISVIKSDGTAELLGATAGQPIYDSQPPLPPGQKTHEETVYRFTQVTNPTCIWEWVGGQYILVVGTPSQCIQQ